MLDQILQDLEKEHFSLTPHFLSASQLNEMNAFIDQHKDEFVAAKVGSADNKQRMVNVRGDFTFWLDPIEPLPEFQEIVRFLESLKLAVNEHFFLGLKQFECHLAYYPSGTFYQKHLDRFEKDSSRSLTFILYLNQEWNKDYGGELVVYDKMGNILRTVYPMPGSLVCFLSDEFPHEVKSSSKERRSFTGWMHTKIIY